MPTRRGWVTINATLKEITDNSFTKNAVIINIKKFEDIEVDLEKEAILILNISKLD